MAKATATALVITPPDIRTIQFKIEGSAPLVINRFSAKARDAMIATQEAGSQAKSKKVREPKDFDALYNGARHISNEGWDGVHAAAFRNACISAQMRDEVFSLSDGVEVNEVLGIIDNHTPEWV